MPHARLGSNEIQRLGNELYARIRPQVESEQNLGKLVSIDVETGDYEIGDDTSLEAPLRLHSRHPGAAIFTVRVGYDAVYALGGVVEPTRIQ